MCLNQLQTRMRQYFIHDGHTKKGPFNFEQLKDYHLKKDTLVWYEGLKEWAKAAQLEDFNDFFIQQVIPPPLPKALEMNAASRDKILSSFEDAAEISGEPEKKSLRWPIIISIIILLGIIATIFFYH